jgi:WD40 repeat protein
MGKPVQITLPNGQIQFSTDKNNLACLWDISTGNVVKKITLPEGGIGSVAFSPDGKYFAVAVDEPEPKIRIWDLAQGYELGVIQGFHGKVCSLAFMPDGKRLISGMDDTTGLVWDLSMVWDAPKKR